MKKVIYLLTLLVICSQSFGQIKISAMPEQTDPPTGGYVPIVIEGVNKKVTCDKIAALALPDQTSNAGKVLSTDGTTPSWITAGSGGDNGLGAGNVTVAATYTNDYVHFPFNIDNINASQWNFDSYWILNFNDVPNTGQGFTVNATTSSLNVNPGADVNYETNNGSNTYTLGINGDESYSDPNFEKDFFNGVFDLTNLAISQTYMHVDPLDAFLLKDEATGIPRFNVDYTNGTVTINNSYSLPLGAASAGQTIIGDGSGGSTWGTPATSGWGLTGNSGTTPGTNFIGTTDGSGLMFKVSSVEAGYISPISPYGVSYGIHSMPSLTNTGSGNSAFGSFSLRLNTTGGFNTGIGQSSLGSNVDGTYNTGVGFGTMSVGSSTVGNTAIGAYALGTTGFSGSNNTAIGYGASTGNITTGSYNIVIGANADVPNVTADGQMNIGNIIYGTGNTGGSTGTVSTGNIGIGTSAPDATAELDVTSTTKAFYPPRMTTTQRLAITGMNEGAIVYDLTLHGFYGWNGTSWVAL